jgi:CRISPR-associated protein Cas2
MTIFVVITYDVVADKRRNRIFKALKNHGRHVQYSVFECELRPPHFERLRAKLEKLINPAEDNIRFYFLDKAAIGKIEEIGHSYYPQPDRTAQFLIV